MKVQKRSCAIEFELQDICLQQYIDLRSRFFNALLDGIEMCSSSFLSSSFSSWCTYGKKTMSTTAKKFDENEKYSVELVIQCK